MRYNVNRALPCPPGRRTALVTSGVPARTILLRPPGFAGQEGATLQARAFGSARERAAYGSQASARWAHFGYTPSRMQRRISVSGARLRSHDAGLPRT
jgi:hypothetical protein